MAGWKERRRLADSIFVFLIALMRWEGRDAEP